MAKRKATPEDCWLHYIRTPLADFFRGLRLIGTGDFRNAGTNLYAADMTEVPFSLEFIDEAWLDAKPKLDEPCVWCDGEADRQGYVCVCNAPSEIESHPLPEPEPVDYFTSLLGG